MNANLHLKPLQTTGEGLVKVMQLLKYVTRARIDIQNLP